MMNATISSVYKLLFYLRLLTGLILLVVVNGLASAQTWILEPAACKGVRLKAEGASWQVTTLNSDPQLVGRIDGAGPTDIAFEIDVQTNRKIEDLEAYLGPPISAKTKMRLPAIPASETFQPYRFVVRNSIIKQLSGPAKRLRLDLGRRPGTTLTIRGGKFGKMNAEDRRRIQLENQQREQLVKEASKITRYQASTFEATIEKVSVGSENVTLVGRLPSDITDRPVSKERLSIEEWTIWTSAAAMDGGVAIESNIEVRSGFWRAIFPRRSEGHDRLHSGWRLKIDHQFVTPRRFATQIQWSGDDTPPPRRRPSNQKGLGGIDGRRPLEDIEDLGVTSITVNMLLSPFVTAVGGPDRAAIDVDGEAIYFNPKAFDRFDRIVDWAIERDLSVTAILLVGRAGKPNAGDVLVHPDSDGGQYAMPDLKTRRGAIVYGHVLDEIMRHYGIVGSDPAKIDNWIVHNEIDQHYAWTNMGRRPRPMVLETYYRSMRTVQNAARQYNPHAVCFASLTHHWAYEDDGNDDRLSPRDVLTDLQRFAALEGDFQWGVAYHPYPTALTNEIAWDDPKALPSDQTDIVSIANIEVLMNFLDARAMRSSKGQVRPVLLSEQGFHTKNYSPESQRNQAASLLYAMERIKPFPSIESFHYHRWIDHPTEGGLKMGLRTLPTKGNPIGEKKLSWEVYRDFGTERASDWTTQLPRPKR